MKYLCLSFATFTGAISFMTAAMADKHPEFTASLIPVSVTTMIFAMIFAMIYFAEDQTDKLYAGDTE